MKLKQILIVIIIISLAIPLYYFNSDHYLLNIARKRRDSQIQEYNKIKKEYKPEGVYIFNRKIYENKTKINEFGKEIYYSVDKGNQTIRFSFTSEEIIIDYPYSWSIRNRVYHPFKENESKIHPIYSHVKEVIKFDHNYEYNFGSWYFYIIQWRIINPITGDIIQDVLKEIESAEKEKTNERNYVFLTIANRSYFSSNWEFQTVGQYLYFDKQTESYDNIFVPIYCSNFRYTSDTYDLENYKPRKSWKDLMDNLFSHNKSNNF